MLQTNALLGDGSRFVDLMWRKDDRHGSDILRVQTDRTGTTTIDLVAMVSWDPRYSDGWRRYAFDVPPRTELQPARLTVVGSPEVEIEPNPRLDPPLPVSIVRVQRADYVPQEGELIRVGALLPLDLLAVATRIPMDDPFATTQLSTVAQTDLAHVRHLPDGVVVTHGTGQWEVQIKVDPRASAAFAFEVTAAPAGGLRLLAQSAFRVRVARRGAVTVEYRQRTTRAQVRPGFGVHGDTSSVADVDVGDDSSAEPIPMSGLTLDRARGYRPAEMINRYPDWETTVANLVLTFATTAPVLAGSLAGFTPLIVLGTIYDFGVPLYAMVTGRDLVGTEVGTDQIVLLGVCAMVGAALDYGPEFLKLSKGLLDRLIPATERAAVEAAMNPALARQLLQRTSPMLAEAVGDITEPEAARLVQAMETAATSRSSAAFRELGDAVTEILLPRLAKAESIGEIPVPRYREVMRLTNVADAPAFLTLTAAQRATVAGRYAEAILRGDPGLLRLAEISPELAKQYDDLVTDAVIGRVFTASLDGFRTATMDNPALGTSLGAGYEAYKAAKLRAGKTPRNVLDWAFQQRPNSRYYPMLVAELGPDFKELLRPVVKAARYAVDQNAADAYTLVLGMVTTYEILRALLTGKNVGHLLQADHILEQRFAKYFEGLLPIGTDNFQTIVVPYNSTVVEGLKKFGHVVFPYTHTQKTALLRRLIPYGTEGTFTVQEIYNAYRLAYLHEFGLAETAQFKEALDTIFTEFWAVVRKEAREAGAAAAKDIRLADVLRKRGLDTTELTREQLLESVMRAQSRTKVASPVR